MWLVRIALSRPYTFIVMALVILLLSPVVVLRTPTGDYSIFTGFWYGSRGAFII